MKNNFLPFSLPDIGDEEIAEVVSSLKSGWLTTGPKAKQFEEDFAAFIGNGVEAVAVNSATAGLHLALEAAGIGPGDKVITTPYTFTATAEVVRYLGADPVFVDIDPQTFNIDPERIVKCLEDQKLGRWEDEKKSRKNRKLRNSEAKRIRKNDGSTSQVHNVSGSSLRIKGIIPVHFGGLSCDMDRILEISKVHNLKVIEDAAHALPSSCNRKLIGALESDATVYSFYATKTITTGEGGMIVTRDSALAERCRVMRLHGISSDAFDRYTSSKPKWFYEVIAPGYKYNMTDIAASIGIHQLKKAWNFHKRRAEMAARYDEAFKDLPVILPPHAPAGDVHAWHLYVIRLTEDVRVKSDEFIEKMYEKGIGCSVHFIPLHLHPYWRDRYALKPEEFPVAQKTYERVVSLPLYTRMTDNDQERVIRAVKEILNR